MRAEERIDADMRVVVLGLGKSGSAAVRYLSAQGVKVGVSEYREQGQLSSEELALITEHSVELETGGHSEQFCTDTDCIVVSPGVPLDLPVLVAARQQGIPILGELALAADEIRVPVIAVTGSNGKTTVTGLIGHLLQAAGKTVFVGGNIGTPILEYLINPEGFEVVVLELSSFQLESAGSFRPDMALLLNLSPDHLDWHGTMERYVGAKRKIFAHQGKGDTAIIGADDPLVMVKSKTTEETTAETVLTFGTELGCRSIIKSASIQLSPGFGDNSINEEYPLSATGLASRVNRYNAAAAVLAARSFGCSQRDIQAGLADFQPPLHRMTPVAEINGVFFVNDSKATNVGAVLAALAGFDNRVILIVGGRDKGSDFAPLVPVVQRHVKELVLIGEAGSTLARVLGDVVTHRFADSMENAVQQGFEAADAGETVLLAPACASFDMFKNYEQRGDVFTQCVLDLQSRVEGDRCG